ALSPNPIHCVFRALKPIPQARAIRSQSANSSPAWYWTASQERAATMITPSSTYDTTSWWTPGEYRMRGVKTSATYAPNRKGDSGEPCGTPLLTWYTLDTLPLKRNRSERQVVQRRTQSRRLVGHPLAIKKSDRRSTLILSKPPSMSMDRIKRLYSSLCFRNSKTTAVASWTLRLHLDPNWFSPRSRQAASLNSTIRSATLAAAGNPWIILQDLTRSSRGVPALGIRTTSAWCQSGMTFRRP